MGRVRVCGVEQPVLRRREVTLLLGDWSGGGEGALEKLFPLVQSELYLGCFSGCDVRSSRARDCWLVDRAVDFQTVASLIRAQRLARRGSK
jgi:hypothetical protein